LPEFFTVRIETEKNRFSLDLNFFRRDQILRTILQKLATMPVPVWKNS
jgi:hypothetical protein